MLMLIVSQISIWPWKSFNLIVDSVSRLRNVILEFLKLQHIWKCDWAGYALILRNYKCDWIAFGEALKRSQRHVGLVVKWDFCHAWTARILPWGFDTTCDDFSNISNPTADPGHQHIETSTSDSASTVINIDQITKREKGKVKKMTRNNDKKTTQITNFLSCCFSVIYQPLLRYLWLSFIVSCHLKKNQIN